MAPLPARAAGNTAAASSVKQWTLPNQLHVVYVPDAKAPVVTVQLFYHAGGKDEPADKRGIAHMFEHMMFKGSRHVRPEEHARFIDAVGGNENAFTEYDVTAYDDTIPPSALEFTLKLEAERMRGLELTQKTIDSERQVVIEELRVGLENNPISKALDAVMHLAFKVHPYRQEAIGEKKMLETVTLADCHRFYDTYYQPNNATLVIAGDVDEASVKRLVDASFGAIPAGQTPPRPSKALVEPPQAELRETTLIIPVQLPVIIGAYHIPAADSADIVPLEVLQRVLSGGESSRLYARLVRKEHTAVFAGGQLAAHEEPGVFLTFAAFLPGGDPKAVRAALEDEVAQLAQRAVLPKELTKAKNQLASEAARRRERVADLATQIGLDGIVAKDPLRSYSVMARYDAVTAKDVQRVARKYLVPTNESVVVLQPPAPAGTVGGAK